MNKKKVLLVGAGNIAQAHASIIAASGYAQLRGVLDVNPATARALAAAHHGVQVYESTEEALRSDCDTVHVLTPPDLHLASALPFVQAGKTVLLEKPVGASSAECRQLAQAAAAAGAVVGVNQNLAFNPAYRQLKALIESGDIGCPRHLSCIYEAPLRQLSARQFSHWMFREPKNILLEQAVHPLSQIVDLAGRIQELAVQAELPIEISPGVGLHNACQVAMVCERMPASLRFHVGANFTVFRITVVCDDGMAVADVFANQFHVVRRGPYMEPIDNWLSIRATARQWRQEAYAGLRDYALSMVKLKSRSDSFYLGMKGSLDNFYADLAATGRPRIDLDFGAHLVDVCEDIARAFKPLPRAAAAQVAVLAAPVLGEGSSLVTLLGGTGFIGAYTVQALLRRGYRVRVMARGVANLQSVFYQPGVEVVRGDVKRVADVDAAVHGAQFVINLAHGGGGSSFAAIRAAMVDTALAVAQAAKRAGVQRLVHVGSISGLYLGEPGSVITGATPPDPVPHTRNDYAHAKALADVALLAYHRESGLPLVLLRPGLVIGAGTAALHGGLGFFNNEQYCIGWNDGSNALPWVLVDDCAEAIASALSAPDAAGKAYNLVGDVRLDAREYIARLGRATGRPLRFVPSSPTMLWLTELGKWVVKRVAGRQVPRPHRRDILSRGLTARFDCSDAKRDLAWQPESDVAAFEQRAIRVHTEV